MPFINRAWGKDLMTVVNPVSAITYIEAAAQVRKVAMLRHQNEEGIGYNICIGLLRCSVPGAYQWHSHGAVFGGERR